jgi:thiosulfate/3-mercaptopyruvate sulfurtransferase
VNDRGGARVITGSIIAMLRTDETPAPKLPSRWLVSTDWLAEHLRDGNLVTVDGSFFLPIQGRDAHAEYRAGHIPGAVFFDIEAVSDHSTELPHMLPGAGQFGVAAGALGIGDGDTVVVYDSLGLYSAPRVWWTFRLFGAKNVYILDGGLPQWKAEGRPTEAGDTQRPAKKFTAEMNVDAVAMTDDVRMALADERVQVVDARSAERFSGKAPEPRPGLRSGHMPGAFNLPYGRLIENGHLVARERIKAAFTDAGVDVDKPIITSCGSGVTAAILTFALDAIGKDAKRLYDGSWAEWASRPDLPIVRD